MIILLKHDKNYNLICGHKSTNLNVRILYSYNAITQLYFETFPQLLACKIFELKLGHGTNEYIKTRKLLLN